MFAKVVNDMKTTKSCAHPRDVLSWVCMWDCSQPRTLKPRALFTYWRRGPGGEAKRKKYKNTGFQL